ncbi:HAD family hydrolase [Candidatus Saccharibacteria bacterium]|nr:HAD family hydrolase [Candidatus Saccharibacteria bacterium]
MKIVLLDRDGTVLVDPPDRSVDRVDKIELYPDTIEALRYLADNDFAAIFVTNQTAIAEGKMDEAQYWRVHEAMMEQIQPSSLTVLKCYLCPHGPNDGCTCRKPKPGMLLDAIRDYGLDVRRVYMVGDRPTDVQAGQSAGVRSILVKTSELSECPSDVRPNYIATSLLDAVKYVVSNSH